MTSRIASALFVLAWMGSAAATAQPLGPVAAEEAARRKTIATPARVITGADLKASPSPFPDASTPASAPTTAAADPRQAREAFTAAKFKGGELPAVAPHAVGGGEVLLELSVGKDGRVGDVSVLRQTPPFTDALVAAARGWTFAPAEDIATPEPGARLDLTTKRPMDSTVLVMGLFRPPSLFPGTLGEVPKTVGKSSDSAPAPAGTPTMPLYPPNAHFDGVVLAELRLSVAGRIENATIVRSAPGFDQPTLDAVKSLSFRPPRVHGRAAASNVYVVAAFRQPIIR